MRFTSLANITCTVHDFIQSQNNAIWTRNVTGRHRDPKRRLWAGYRAPLLHPRPMCRHLLYACLLDIPGLCNARHIFFIMECGIARFFCAVRALCVYSTFRHHPHPLGYLCARFRFSRALHCLVNPWRKIAYSITCSITQSPSLFDVLGTEAFASE